MMRARRREVALEQRPRPLRMTLGESEEGEVTTCQGCPRVGHDGPEPGNAPARPHQRRRRRVLPADRKSTRLNSSHSQISYAVFCLKKKTTTLTSGPSLSSSTRSSFEKYSSSSMPHVSE